MHELRIISLTSSVCAVLFSIILFVIWLDSDDNTHALSEYMYPTDPISGYFQTAPTIFLAYCFQQSFFTVFKSLRDQTSSNGWKITYRSYIVAVSIYFVVTLLSISLFGDNIKSDLMHNVAKNNSSLRYFCLVLFLIIAAMHTPIIFFVGKESLLVIYCELRYKTVLGKVI